MRHRQPRAAPPRRTLISRTSEPGSVRERKQVPSGKPAPRLESIAENGPLETVFRRQNESGSYSDVRSLIDALQNDLQALRDKARRHAKKCSDSKEQLFWRIITPAASGKEVFYESVQKRDPVLLCTIARMEGLGEPFDELFDEAFHLFRSRADEYCAALGNLLPSEFTDAAKRIAYRDGNNATAVDDLDVLCERLDNQRNLIANRGQLGVPTGLPELDTALSGIRGLTLLAAPKGAGKTTLMLSTVRETLRKCPDVAVLLLSFDEPKDRIYQRLLCIEAGISFRQLMKPDDKIRELLDQSKRNLASSLSRLRVVERRVRYPAHEPHSNEVLKHRGFDLDALREDLDVLGNATESANVLLCVDLFQKWPVAEDVAAGADADHFRLDVIDTLRRASATPEYPDGFPMLVLSEVRKDAARELDMNDLKGDGRMTSDADCVLLMYPVADRSDPQTQVVPMTIRISKGRDGVDRVDVPLWFDFRHLRFLEQDPRQRPEQASSANRETPDVHAHGRSRSSKRRPESQGLDPLAT